MRELTEEERKKHTDELDDLLCKNEEFLKKNSDLCKDAILDLGKLIYRCEHENEMALDDKNLSKNAIDDIDEELKQRFNSLLENKEENFIIKVCNAIKKMRLIKYQDIRIPSLK